MTRPLFPPIQENFSDFLSRDGHQIYFEESGNPQGIPAVYLHGGPGAGSSPAQRRYFNPEKYRIILFDQRGAGRSTPPASIKNNTVWDLVDDIEALRQHLNIDKWLVAGGSWGSTLGLVYAIKHAERVTGLILRGIFLGTRAESSWLFQPGGASEFYPDLFEQFLAPISPGVDTVKAYAERLASPNEIRRITAAKAWSTWENQLIGMPAGELERANGDAHQAICKAQLENHYLKNHCFLEDNYILDNVNKIQDIPSFLIHGRLDMVCQLGNAYRLAKIWPQARLQIIPKAGHWGLDPAIVDAIVKATDNMANFINDKNNQ